MTTAELRIPQDLHAVLMADITRPQEWAGYLLCGVIEAADRLVFLGREWCPVPERHQIKGTSHGMTWHADFDVDMLNRAQRERLGCVVLHYHGGTAPRISGTDCKTRDSLMPFLSAQMAARPHAFGVMADGTAAAQVYRKGRPITEIGMTSIPGRYIDIWPSTIPAAPLSIDPRHDRLIRGFGPTALMRLRGARVAVVGCGGGGSHVIQQLAYLGVGAFVLVDGDRVEATNLNRLIGALPGRRRRGLLDRLLRRGRGDLGRLKTDVMERLIGSVSEDATVLTISEQFPSPATADALRECDIVVACVDRLQVRDDLNRLCKRYLIPLLDVGLEIVPGGGGTIAAISGRVTKVLPDGPCLRCQGVIDDGKLARERGGRPLGYAGAAGLPDPAVVTLNGLVASIAATEVLQLLTGFAGENSPNCGWLLDGLTGTVEKVHKPFRPCAACKHERGAGDS